MHESRGFVGWSSRTKAALRFAPLALAVGILIFVFRGLDFSRLALLVRSRGPWLLVIVVPWGVVAALDAFAWRMLFLRISRGVSYLRLFGVRLSAEAVLMSVPSGSLVADGLTPHLLKTRCGVPVTEGLACIAARKCLLGLGQALYLGLASAVGYSAIRATSAVTGMHAPEQALLGFALVLLLGSVVVARLLARGTLARFLQSLLLKVPSRRLRSFLREHAEGFEHTDAHLARVFHGHVGTLAPPVAIYTVAWVIESLETFLILSLLGSGLRYPQVMPMEATLATIRVMAFFVPAGLGIQDLGYVAFLKALGVEDAVSLGAAFVLLKRAKEASWIALGYLLLAKQPELKAP